MPPEDRSAALARRLLSSGFLVKGEVKGDAYPEKVGGYVLAGPLGRGGAGHVYLAHDPKLGRSVAIKILESERRVGLERFRREIRLLANLHHPNIIQVYDAGIVEGRPYYVMEYSEGGTLADASLTLEEAVGVLIQVALACHAAHEHGVVHRDLKPENILLASRPLVLDFGVAKILDSCSPSLTAAGAMVGTPSYMSPEQLQGGDIGPTSDVFSLGVILYEQLTGVLPTEATNLVELACQLCSEEAPDPLERDSTLPRSLAETCRRALARDPNDRQQSALTFARELGAWRNASQPDARSGMKKTLAFAVGALVLAALLGAAGVSLTKPDALAPAEAEEVASAPELPPAPLQPSPQRISPPSSVPTAGVGAGDSARADPQPAPGDSARADPQPAPGDSARADPQPAPGFDDQATPRPPLNSEPSADWTRKVAELRGWTRSSLASILPVLHEVRTRLGIDPEDAVALAALAIAGLRIGAEGRVIPNLSARRTRAVFQDCLSSIDEPDPATPAKQAGIAACAIALSRWDRSSTAQMNRSLAFVQEALAGGSTSSDLRVAEALLSWRLGKRSHDRQQRFAFIDGARASLERLDRSSPARARLETFFGRGRR